LLLLLLGLSSPPSRYPQVLVVRQLFSRRQVFAAALRGGDGFEAAKDDVGDSFCEKDGASSVRVDERKSPSWTSGRRREEDVETYDSS
jgi:hypothetical protein